MNHWTKIGLSFLIVALAIIAWLYLTGGIFLALVGLDYNSATPLTAISYWYHYSHDSYVMSNLRTAFKYGVVAVIIILPLFLLLLAAKKSLYGNARFAKKSEIKKSGLLDGEGVIVGKYENKYLQLKGQLHVILSAPTRSGKGVGVVIPNLLTWKHSVVVLDIKQENWDITSAFRQKHGQKCYMFNPLAIDYRTHRYNPLSYIDPNPDFRINDIQKIANMLFPDKPNTDPIWTSTPRSFFLGVVLFLIESGQVLTIGQVLRESLNDGDGTKYFKKAIKDASEDGKPFSGACVRALNSYIGIAAENTRAGIITGFRSALELWMNPIIDAATDANDFDLRKIREENISIYVGVTPDNLERVAPLLNLFFQQLIDLNTRELPHQNKNIKHDCLLLMDEFTAIGKIPVLAKGISYIAGYGLRMLPIIQSPSQLVDVYGKEAAETFTVNHALNIVFPPKATETNTAKDISEWLGYETVDGVATSKKKTLFTRRDPSENISDQRRALLLPQEITSLDSEKEIVVFENLPPILATKIRYFKDDIFLKRLQASSSFLANLKDLRSVKKELLHAITSGYLAAEVPKIKLNTQSYDTNYDIEQFNDEMTEKEVTAEDILDIHNKALADFSVNFTDINPPEGNTMDEQALRDYADKLCKEAGILVKMEANDILQEL